VAVAPWSLAVAADLLPTAAAVLQSCGRCLARWVSLLLSASAGVRALVAPKRIPNHTPGRIPKRIPLQLSLAGFASFST